MGGQGTGGQGNRTLGRNGTHRAQGGKGSEKGHTSMGMHGRRGHVVQHPREENALNNLKACCKHLLYNKFLKHIYPGPTHLQSKSTRTQPTNV